MDRDCRQMRILYIYIYRYRERETTFVDQVVAIRAGIGAEFCRCEILLTHSTACAGPRCSEGAAGGYAKQDRG